MNLYSLLVGAPRAQTGRIRTGALFKCDLNTRTHDCVNLYVDPDNSTCKWNLIWFCDLWNIYISEKKIVSENIDKEDQWLGVTVKSQGEGGKFCFCFVWKKIFQSSNDHTNRLCNGLCPSLCTKRFRFSLGKWYLLFIDTISGL